MKTLTISSLVCLIVAIAFVAKATGKTLEEKIQEVCKTYDCKDPKVKQQCANYCKKEECQLKDSDSCLQSSPHWKGTNTCTDSEKHCGPWGKDMKRCCPVTCKLKKELTKNACSQIVSKGVCDYPNDAQCPENLEANGLTFTKGIQGSGRCSEGAPITDAITCKDACRFFKKSQGEILGYNNCYIDRNELCHQNGHHGLGATMICKTQN